MYLRKSIITLRDPRRKLVKTHRQRVMGSATSRRAQVNLDPNTVNGRPDRARAEPDDRIRRARRLGVDIKFIVTPPVHTLYGESRMKYTGRC
jgi:hypothetical protein